MQVLEAFQNMRSELTDLMQLKKGQIRIGIPPIVGAEFFSKLISVYKEQHPYIEILLTEVGTKRIREEIETGELDIGLVCSVTSTNENLETIRFLKDPLQLIVHESHRLAGQKTIAMSDLANEAFIIYRKDFILFDRIIEECKNHGFYPTIACETTQKDLFIEMVQAKLGIALLPQKIAEKIPYDSIKRIPFEEQAIHLELGITWKKNKYLPYSVREFIQLAHEFVLQWIVIILTVKKASKNCFPDALFL